MSSEAFNKALHQALLSELPSFGLPHRWIPRFSPSISSILSVQWSTDLTPDYFPIISWGAPGLWLAPILFYISAIFSQWPLTIHSHMQMMVVKTGVFTALPNMSDLFSGGRFNVTSLCSGIRAIFGHPALSHLWPSSPLWFSFLILSSLILLALS